MADSSFIAKSFARWTTRLIFIFLSLVVLYPLFWNLMASLKSNTELMDNNAFALPKVPHFDNYARAFRKAHMGEYMFNSIYVTVASLVVLYLLTLTSAYGLTRYRNWLSSTIKTIYQAGLFIQVTVLVIPIFLLLNSIGLTNSREGLILVYAVGALPFSVYLLTGYMVSLPMDYEEAAMIDGCGRWRTLFTIIAPLVQPGLITVMIFNFFTFWNEYILALTLIYDDAKRTLPIGLSNLFEVARYATDWGALFAALSIVLIPTIVVYSFTQKKLTEGVTAGGIKG
jgi:N-acetylglucosamine transport system permease protein